MAETSGRPPAELWFEFNGEHSVQRLEEASYRVGRAPSNELSFPELKSGEGMLVFTDGVTEARNRNGEFHEESRLEAYLAASASRPVDELVRGLQSEVERFEAGAPRADDITALALRWLLPAG
jgi:serine phosphatase RsbU (regulator of sigma subunit)